MHTFHVACIASNVRHGSVTCPICRAHWSQLPPRDSSSISAASTSAHEPVLRILDHSIATSRVNHLSFLRSASRYNDDDPVEPHAIHHPDSHPRLRLSFLPDHLCPHLIMPAHHRYQVAAGSPRVVLPRQNASPNAQSTRRRRRAFLSVNLSPQPPTDLVLVASPNGPHLRLLKQSMALVVFWLRRVDRLAIVTYSTTSTRAFPLRRMTAQGKRAALQIIDRLFYSGEAEPTEGLRKAVKVLEDRRHHNPLSCILHLSDHPTTTRSYVCRELPFPVPVHRFHIGFGFGMTNGFVIHELEELLARLVGGVIREAQLRIGEDGRLVRLGELRGGEERRIPLELIGDCDCTGFITVGYSYVEGGGGGGGEGEGRLRTGEIVVDSREKRNSSSDDGVGLAGSDMRGRSGSYCVQERWDYLDPLMARRWPKHLHGHKA